MAIGCGLLDLLTDHWKVLQRQLFLFVLLTMYVVLVIRYYYGPDIWLYVPHYEGIPHPSQLLAHPEMASFEFGYDMFCSLAHWSGMSYWGMTAIITTLYFLALGLLLRLLPKRQIFALGCIILMDYHMIINENRECLAVTFFIFAVLLLQKRHYILALLCAMVTILTHKSGFMPVGLLLVSAVLYNCRQNTSLFTLLTIALLIMIALPVQRISGSILQILPLPGDYIKSIQHHLQLGRQIQIIGAIYLLVLFAINMFLHYGKQTRYTWIALVALVGLTCVVVFYQYYYLLNRIRSYFVPFVIYYVIMLMSDEERSRLVPYASLIKQSMMVLLLVYYVHLTATQIRAGRQLHEPIHRACTVFQLRNASEKQIRNRQMQLAYQYWTRDFMKSGDNKL